MVALLDDPDHHALVVELEGEVRGWVHVGVRRTLHKATHAEIVALVVGEHPPRPAASARRCSAEAESVGGRARPRDGSLRSREDRRDAHRFYERLGYAKESLSYNLSCALPRAR